MFYFVAGLIFLFCKAHFVRSYGFTDEAPYKGIGYYRLTQVDIDGFRTTYNWVSAATDNTYPKPGVRPGRA